MSVKHYTRGDQTAQDTCKILITTNHLQSSSQAFRGKSLGQIGFNERKQTKKHCVQTEPLEENVKSMLNFEHGCATVIHYEG